MFKFFYIFIIILLYINIILCDYLLPSFHINGIDHWVNDPNGPTFYNDIFHLFYQEVPNQNIWTPNITWGHVYSIDFAHWYKQKGSIFDTDLNYLDEGAWSGSITLVPSDDNNDIIPIISYTCVNNKYGQQQCQAYPDDINDPYLLNWSQDELNPLISIPPNDVNNNNFRDPTTAWKSEDNLYWNMLIGIAINDINNSTKSRGNAALYQSSDFQNWNLIKNDFFSLDLEIEYENNNNYTYSWIWECPDFYQLKYNNNNDKIYIIKYSDDDLDRQDWYMIGNYDKINEKFIPSNGKTYLIDYGDVYASKSFLYNDRRIIWGWSPEQDLEINAYERGWQGIQTLQRDINFNDEFNVLEIKPSKELELLRTNNIMNINDFLKQMMNENNINHNQYNIKSNHNNNIILNSNDMNEFSFYFDKQSTQFELKSSFQIKISSELNDIPNFKLGYNIFSSGNHISETNITFQNNINLLDYENILFEIETIPYSYDNKLNNKYTPIFQSFHLSDDGKYKYLNFDLHIFVDHSVVEIFDNVSATTARCYPNENENYIGFFYSLDNNIKDFSIILTEFNIWELETIWIE